MVVVLDGTTLGGRMVAAAIVDSIVFGGGVADTPTEVILPFVVVMAVATAVELALTPALGLVAATVKRAHLKLINFLLICSSSLTHSCLSV